jgi:ribosomal protein S12 methylthiotransferase
MNVYFVSLGCPKNTVDMEAALSLLRRAGHVITDDPHGADVLLVNSCSFLESAWAETLEEVDRLTAPERGAARRKLVLMGCLPRHRDGDLKEMLPAVDLFLPPGRHGSLPAVLRSWEDGGPGSTGSARAVPETGDPFAGFEDRSVLTPPHTAYVKIGEGCGHACDFCAIPAITGPPVWRSPSSILREVGGLVDAGVREITLIAQDPAAYSSAGKRLPDLMEMLPKTGVEWIRVLYVHPSSIRVRELARIFDVPGVCHYLDIPVQHASDRILERMKRGYTKEYLERLLDEVRHRVPDIVLRSEVITGYPGETEDDFEELKEFITNARFASLGIFSFSPEPGTPARDRADAVPPDVKAARFSELLSLHEGLAFGIHSEFVGKTLDVLVDRALDDEEEGGGYRYAGRYYGQAFEADGEVMLRGDDIRIGQFVPARIEDAAAYDLMGEAGKIP